MRTSNTATGVPRPASVRRTASPGASSGPARSHTVHSRRRGTQSRARHRAAYAFVLPFMALFVGMLLVPLGYALYLSLFTDRLIGGTVFVGLDNYTDVLGDGLFRDGVLRMARFLLVQVPIMLTLSLLFALALDSARLRWARLIRLGIFLPYAVPSVVAALMWGYLYGPDFGPIAQSVRGLGGEPPDLLGDGWMLVSIGNIVTWEFVGYNMIILYAALRSVPPDLYEAAAVDGAGAIRTAWSIKIPSIRPALVLTLIFSVIGTFQLFNEPQVMRALAPDVIGSAYTPNLYAYTLAFTNQQLNYSAAVSFMLGFVILVLTYAVLFVMNRGNRR
ncbi:carbohydrate ABC transporter permease [Micromonospora sp. BQ11]|uniref:carbohydrate ABC transporter permease n=1 Tax=Micromonospora sp. BQ11 TaxID=3452212 RepID=UPI003F8C5B98